MSQEETLTLKAGSSTLRLSAAGGLSFMHRGRQFWQTPGPLAILHYYDRQHPRAQAVAVPWHETHAFGTPGTLSMAAKSEIAFERLDEGRARVAAQFKSLSVRVVFEIALREDGEGFRVVIPEGGIVEDHADLYRILALEVLPEFGAARTGEQGYLTLPNWFGCRTFYDKDVAREVVQSIYSSNDEWEHDCNMPVWGITRAQGTLAGLVAKGDFDAELVCRQHWEKVRHNSIHPRLIYRWQQQEERLAGDREVRYRFAPADYDGGEGYVLVGKLAREFYRQDRGLKTWKEKRVEATRDYAERFFLKVFMAYKDPHPEGTGEYHATCTFDEAREILTALKERGVGKLTATVVGWGQDGHDGMPPTRFPVDERLGGEAKMKELNAWCRENGIVLAVHDSYGASYSCSPEHDIANLVRHRSGEYWASVIWSGGHAHVMCPAVWLDRHARRDMPAVAALGIHGHHHIDAVGSFMTCFSEEHPLPKRADYCAQVHKMFEIAIENLGSVSTELPFGPYFDVVDGFFHSYIRPYKWHLASSIGRYFYDESVPLLNVVLHGCINLGMHMPGDELGLLRMIDFGNTPQFEVAARKTGPFGVPAYHEHVDRIAEMYHLFYGENGIARKLLHQTVEARREILPGVHETVYCGGTRVQVNLTDEAWEDLPARSYRILEA